MNDNFKPLEEITVNGQKYVNKAELLALIKSEKKKCMEGTEPGYMQKKKGRRIAAMLSLNHLSVLLCKRFYNDLREDMFKYLICGMEPESSVVYYFRGWCGHVAGREGKRTPIFSEDHNDAIRFEDREEATEIIQEMRKEYPNLSVAPVQVAWTLNEPGIRIIHNIFGWPKGREDEIDEVIKEELMWRRKPE